jgi:hypothetical protein
MPPKKNPAPVQIQAFTTPNPKCGTPEHQAQLDAYLNGLNPDQLDVIRSFMNTITTGAAIMGGYRKSIHYMKEWFGAHPNPVQLA